MTPPRWTVITDYPRWPSPYFQQFEAALAPHLDLRFTPALPALDMDAAETNVINLHRLARLYRGRDRRPDAKRARQFLADLNQLRGAGWRLVWTIHNLYPIYANGPTDIDRQVTYRLLHSADLLITHTVVDADFLASRTPTPIVTAGSAGLDAIPDQKPSLQIRHLADFLTAAPVGILALGNLAPYKGLPLLAETFLAATHAAHLVICGRSADLHTTRALTATAERSGGRILLHAEPVPPGAARFLCGRATALLTPYRADAAFAFFRDVLHPSSVAMAVGFGTPVIAPDLPSIRELTNGHPRALYQDIGDFASTLMRVERGGLQRPATRSSDADRWSGIAAAYRRAATTFASQSDESLR